MQPARCLWTRRVFWGYFFWTQKCYWFQERCEKKPCFMFSRGFTKLISQGQFSKNTKFRCSRVAVKVFCIIKVLQDYRTTMSAGHLLKPENSVRLHGNIKNWQSNLQRSFKVSNICVRNFLGIFTHWHCAVHRWKVCGVGASSLKDKFYPSKRNSCSVVNAVCFYCGGRYTTHPGWIFGHPFLLWREAGKMRDPGSQLGWAWE